MLALFDGYTGLERFFAYCAFFGGLLLIVRFVLQMFGASHDADTGFDAGSAADAAQGHHDVGFKLMSVQGFTAFFLMFGLVGLALLRQSKVSPTIAIIGAVIAGTIMMWLMAVIFAGMKHLQASGNINLNKAIGCVGTVYVHIPADSSGQVQLCIQDRLRIYDAVSKNKTEIKTGDRVKVVDIVSANTLIVEHVD